MSLFDSIFGKMDEEQTDVIDEKFKADCKTRAKMVEKVLDLLVDIPIAEAKRILEYAYENLDERCIVVKQEDIDGYKKIMR